MSYTIHWNRVALVHHLAEEATEDMANEILDRAQALAPVDTGHLKGSGFVEGSGGKYVIGFRAHYAHFVEFGTRKMAAQPFLRPAIGLGMVGWRTRRYATRGILGKFVPPKGHPLR